MPGEQEYQEALLELSKSKYDMGLVVEKLTQSAKQDYPFAYVWLHILYSLPCFDQCDISIANKWRKSILTEKSLHFISNKALKEKDEHAKFLYGYLCHHELGFTKDLPLAIKCYEDSNLYKNQIYGRYLRADAFYLLGCQECASGHFQSGIKYFRHAQKIKNDFVPSFLGHGKALAAIAEELEAKGYLRGDDGADQLYNQAIGYYRVCLLHNKNDAKVHYGMGKIFSHLEQYKLAIKHLENATSIEKDNLIYQNELSKVKRLGEEKAKTRPKRVMFADQVVSETKRIPAPTDSSPSLATNPIFGAESKLGSDEKKLNSSLKENNTSFFHSPPSEAAKDQFTIDADGGIISHITQERIPPNEYFLIFACKINAEAGLDWDQSTVLYMEGVDSGKQGFIYRIRCSPLTKDDGNSYIVEADKISPAKLKKDHYQMFFLKSHMSRIDSTDGNALLDKTENIEFSFNEGMSLKGSVAEVQFKHFQGCKHFLKSISSSGIVLPNKEELPVSLADESKSTCLIL